MTLSRTDPFTVREMTDSSGTIKVRYDYDPYGARIKIQGTLDADFGYAGYFMFASQPEHTFTLFRIYRPDLGRWLSRDPLAELTGLNLYAYVANNPINFYDPLGLADIIIGDTEINTALQEAYNRIQNKVKYAGVPVSEMSFLGDYYDLMISLDTYFKYDRIDTFTYCGKDYPLLYGKTFTGSDLNYLGVGAGFAARGAWPTTMDIEIDARLHAMYNVKTSSNTYDAAQTGYNAYNQLFNP